LARSISLFGALPFMHSIYCLMSLRTVRELSIPLKTLSRRSLLLSGVKFSNY
jgi:hypothetical protein